MSLCPDFALSTIVCSVPDVTLSGEQLANNYNLPSQVSAERATRAIGGKQNSTFQGTCERATRAIGGKQNSTTLPPVFVNNPAKGG